MKKKISLGISKKKTICLSALYYYRMLLNEMKMLKEKNNKFFLALKSVHFFTTNHLINCVLSVLNRCIEII